MRSEIISSLIVGLILAGVGFLAKFFLALPKKQEDKKIRRQIEELKDKKFRIPDEMRARTSNSLVTQSQLDRMVENASKPIDTEINNLKDRLGC